MEDGKIYLNEIPKQLFKVLNPKDGNHKVAARINGKSFDLYSLYYFHFNKQYRLSVEKGGERRFNEDQATEIELTFF